MRTVFGVTDTRARSTRLGEVLREHARVGRPTRGGWRCWRCSARAGSPSTAAFQSRAAARGRADLRGDPRAPRRAPTWPSATTCSRMLLQARHEDGSPMTDEELRDELMTLLVAGHETTATALAWALEALARHPAALARLRDGGGRRRGRPTSTPWSRRSLRLRPVLAARAAPAHGADGDRRPPAPRRRERRALHLPRAPPRRRLPRPARVPPRALPRAARRAPTRGSRSAAACAAASARASPVRDEGRAARADRPAAGHPPGRRAPRAPHRAGRSSFAPERGGEIVVERRAQSAARSDAIAVTVHSAA